MKTPLTYQSVHPALQAMLPRIAQHMAHEWRPIFEEQEDAIRFLEKLNSDDADANFGLNPVWAINHIDLASSRIVGWSVIPLSN